MKPVTVVTAVALLAASLVTPQALAAEAEPIKAYPAASGDGGGEGDWWRPDYIADYSSILVGAGLWLGLRTVEPADAAFGPRFDASNWEGVLDPGNSDQLGRVHRPDTVSESGLMVWAGVGLAGVMLQEWIPQLNGLDRLDAQLAHDSVIGYLETLSWTLGVTEILKTSIGRLRPDFQDRARRYHCGNLGQTDGACAGWVGEPLEEGDKEFMRGRKSFVSGHASFAFGIATYWSMVIGGRMVWGKRAKGHTVALGVLFQGALMASAAFVTGSRVDDGRHHVSDVLAGSLVGFTLAQVAYWRHFDTDGLPRSRPQPGKVTAQIGPSAAGLGLGVSGGF